MERTIEINGIECRLKASAAIPRMYRIKFRRDIFVDMSKIAKQLEAQERYKKELKARCKKDGTLYEEPESELPIETLEVFENIAYLMHKHGDPSQPGSVDEWIDQFEMFNIYEVFPAILELWGLDNLQLSKSKKNSEK